MWLLLLAYSLQACAALQPDSNPLLALSRAAASSTLCPRPRKTHVLVVELALRPFPLRSHYDDDDGFDAFRGPIATATGWPADSLILLNASAFSRVKTRIRTELSFNVRRSNTPSESSDTASQCEEHPNDDRRVFVLLALGCAQFDGPYASGRLAASLTTADKLVERGTMCRVLATGKQKCCIVRYFAASYHLGTPFSYDTETLQRRKRAAGQAAIGSEPFEDEIYDYYGNETLPDGSGTQLEFDAPLPTSTALLNAVEELTPRPLPTPASSTTSLTNSPIFSTPSLPIETEKSSSTITPSTSPAIITITSVVRRLVVNELQRPDTVKVVVGSTPVFPKLDGLFLLSASSSEPPTMPEPGRLVYGLASLACFGNGLYCQQLRQWLSVCGDELCGRPLPELVGLWQMRLDARLRDEPELTASISFTVSVAPRPVTTEPDPEDKEDEAPNSLRLACPVRRMHIYVGEVLTYQFPPAMLTDAIGAAAAAELTYMVINATTRLSLRRDSWLEFDGASRTIYALPLSSDFCGVHPLLLVVTASGAQAEVVECAFNVTVAPQPQETSITHHFVAVFNISHRTFRRSIRHAIGVLRTVASYFGDTDLHNLAATVAQPVAQIDADPFAYPPPRRAGHMLLFAWCNKSLGPPHGALAQPLPLIGAPARPTRLLPSSADAAASSLTAFQDGCPTTGIRRLLYNMLDPARLSWLSPRFVSRFIDMPLLSLKLIGAGPCHTAFPSTNLFLANIPSTSALAVTMAETRNQPMIRAINEDRALQVTVVAETLPPEAPPLQPVASNGRLPLDGNELLITIVIPSIVIALALVLSALIACILYQKMRQSRRRRCRSAAGSGRVYVKKGVPVIFAEELDERAATAHDTPSRPLILPAEMLDARCTMPNAAFTGSSKH